MVFVTFLQEIAPLLVIMKHTLINRISCKKVDFLCKFAHLLVYHVINHFKYYMIFLRWPDTIYLREGQLF